MAEDIYVIVYHRDRGRRDFRHPDEPIEIVKCRSSDLKETIDRYDASGMFVLSEVLGAYVLNTKDNSDQDLSRLERLRDVINQVISGLEE